MWLQYVGGIQSTAQLGTSWIHECAGLRFAAKCYWRILFLLARLPTNDPMYKTFRQRYSVVSVPLKPRSCMETVGVSVHTVIGCIFGMAAAMYYEYDQAQWAEHKDQKAGVPPKTLLSYCNQFVDKDQLKSTRLRRIQEHRFLSCVAGCSCVVIPYPDDLGSQRDVLWCEQLNAADWLEPTVRQQAIGICTSTSSSRLHQYENITTEPYINGFENIVEVLDEYLDVNDDDTSKPSPETRWHLG